MLNQDSGSGVRRCRDIMRCSSDHDVTRCFAPSYEIESVRLHGRIIQARVPCHRLESPPRVPIPSAYYIHF